VDGFLAKIVGPPLVSMPLNRAKDARAVAPSAEVSGNAVFE
jgi:hypothetical protein